MSAGLANFFWNRRVPQTFFFFARGRKGGEYHLPFLLSWSSSSQTFRFFRRRVRMEERSSITRREKNGPCFVLDAPILQADHAVYVGKTFIWTTPIRSGSPRANNDFPLKFPTEVTRPHLKTSQLPFSFPVLKFVLGKNGESALTLTRAISLVKREVMGEREELWFFIGRVFVSTFWGLQSLQSRKELQGEGGQPNVDE